MTSTPNASLLSLTAPLSGELRPLSDVPDPAFAQKMVGDGVAIDPVEGRLIAPCAGTVALVHPAKHAVSLKTDTNLEVLMHIGIDTVKIGGEGFTVHVSEGQQVKAGDLLIEFDMDGVAAKAMSLMTPVLITNIDQIARIDVSAASSVAAGDALFKAHIGAVTETEVFSGEAIRSKPVAIANHTGIHARPAAHLAGVAKQFKSKTLILNGQRSANARSVVALMGLNINFADEVVIEALGSDAAEAIAAIEAAIRSGLGERVEAVEAGAAELPEQEVSLLLPRDEDPTLLIGVTASPGQAVGPLVKIETDQFNYPETADNAAQQHQEFTQALERARVSLAALIEQMKQDGHADKAEIMGAHLELLADPALEEETLSRIEDGASAPAGWQFAIEQQVDVLEGLNNPLMQQRAADLRDVGVRVIRQLLGMNADPMADLPKGAILAAEELSPSDVAVLNPNKVAGIITSGGGATSHAAIIARSQGIPMLAATDPRILSAVEGVTVLLDASAGRVQVTPTPEQLETLKQKQARAVELAQASEAGAHEPAITQDGVHVEVAANIGNVKEAALAAEKGAEGIGLLRSEFLYLNRVSAPDEETQYQAYREMLEGIGADKPAIVRTLDVGGDKPLPYLPLPKEENPFLGERGIRIGLDRPSILRGQFRALLRAAPHGKLRIMLPMIASLDELRLARRVLEEERAALEAPEVELGVMIEVPSAAMMADVLAEEADFFSIGTNDLTQYTLAIDRGNARLAPLADSLHPAVLRMIDMTVKGAKKHNRWVGVCGGMAAEPAAQPLLLGLGVNELSVSVPALAETKYRIRNLSMQACQQLATAALAARNAREVRELVDKVVS